MNMADDRPTILVIGDPMVPAARMAAPIRDLLGDRYEVVSHDWEREYDAVVATNLAVERGGPDAVDVALPAVDGARPVVAVVTHFFPLGASALADFPDLHVVATLRAGTEHIAADHLAQRRITLVNNAGRNANAVAEMAVTLMLAHLRHVGENHHVMRGGGWRAENPRDGFHELAGSALGLVGLGAVGRLVLRRLAGFELSATYHDPYSDQVEVEGAQPTSLEQVLRSSSVISLHARLTPESRGLIGAPELEIMRPDALLVNTARAELVDEAALLAALDAGRIAGAALDVFTAEPLSADHPLRSHPRVLLSPHLAGVTVEARARAPHLLASRLADALATAEASADANPIRRTD